MFVADSYFGWSHNAASALSIVDVGEAVLDKLECVEAADTIYADTTTNKLTVMLFATELGLLPGEDAAAVTAEAEDAAHTRYPLTVEYVGGVPGFAWMTAIIVRLNDNLSDVGDVLVNVTAHGLRSNRVRIGIGHLGGGPPDDLGDQRP